LHWLEDRAVPAIITVNTIADNTSVDGKCSLREAIMSINNAVDLNADVTAARSGAYSNDSIVFDATLFSTPQTIALLSALPQITSDTSLQGTTAANSKVSGAALFQIFSCNTAHVSFSNMTITGGSASNGAGIFVQSGSVSFTGCTLFNNSASLAGGGVYVSTGASVTVSNSTLSGNSAGTRGGGIYFFSSGNLAIEDSTVTGNKASGGTGGGGIYCFSNSTVIRNSTIVGNMATAGRGGGIAIQSTANVTIQNSTIANNSASTTGGGINFAGASDTLSIESTIVAKNLAPTGPDVNGTVMANFSLLSNSGGATIIGGNNKLNVDPQLGSLANYGGSTQTMAISITSPAVNNGSNPSGAASDQRGNGFERVAGGLADIGAFEIQPDYVVTNTNEGLTPGTLRTAITNADGNSGTHIIDFAAGLTGTITLTSGELPISNPLFIGAPLADAITISGNNASRIFNDAAVGSVQIVNLALTQGKSSGNGGAVFAGSASTLVLINCTISGSSASGRGGGIYLGANTTLTISTCAVTGNSAGVNGGGIYFFSGGSLTMIGSTVSGNKSNTVTLGNGGAGVYFFGIVSAGGLTIRNSTIAGNSATSSGGGGILLSNVTGTLTVQNSTITGNSAITGGGIARVNGTASISIESSILYGDTAGTGPEIFTTGTATVIKSLVAATAGVTTFNGDAFTNANIGVNPNLGFLDPNGGPDWIYTCQPAAGSKAIDNGSNPAGLTTDQRGRGFSRLAGAAVDIGAVEVQLVNLLVTNALDSGPGSLRQAMNDASQNIGADTITFDPAFFYTPRTIILTSGQLVTYDKVTIIGPGAALATVSGNNASGVFAFHSGTDNSILSGLTVTKGSDFFGGGIYGYGALTVESCIISSNSAGNAGGGVFADPGPLTLADCVVINNTAPVGGGVCGFNGVVIQRSTISGNTAGTAAGGIYATEGFNLTESTISNNSASANGGGVMLRDISGATYVVRNCTISGNTSTGGNGGGIALGYSTLFPFNSTLTVQNCTITNNKATNGSGGGIARIFGTGAISVASSVVSGNSATSGKDISSAGTVNVNWSAIGSTFGFTLTGSNNLPIGADLKLGPLASNGGAYQVQTQTHMPALDSPLIDQGSNPAGLSLDQRGFSRAIGNGYDIGAVEVQPTTVVSITDNNPTPTSQQIVSWNVQFGYPETGLTAANFVFSGPGAFGAYITRVTGGGTIWTVSAATGAEGALELDMVNSANLSVLPTNLPFSGQAYFVNKTPLTAMISANVATINDYKIGPSALTLTASFSEPMNTAVMPTFSFPVENPGGALGFASGSWTNATTYQAKYNVFDTNLLLSNIHVQISGAQDSGNNAAGPFTNAAVFSIDTQNPIVSSITLNNPALNNLSTVGWTVTFSKPVTGVNASDFSLFNGGLSGTPMITNVMGSSTTWTVQASGYAGQGSLGLYVTSTAGVTDADGNLLGALPVSGPTYAIDPVPPTVFNILVNDGSVQRSRVTSITVTFIELVNFAGAPANAFALTGPNGAVTLAVDTSGSTPIQTVAKLTFSGATTTDFTSLKDGRYTLKVLASQVTDLAGNSLDGNGDGTGGDDYVEVGAPGSGHNLFRFYGDINGDGTVSASDFIQFRQYFGGYLFAFDFDNDGAVAASDFIQFRLRFGGSI
jgi:CSLREA domain-containing protein